MAYTTRMEAFETIKEYIDANSGGNKDYQDIYDMFNVYPPGPLPPETEWDYNKLLNKPILNADGNLDFQAKEVTNDVWDDVYEEFDNVEEEN